MARFPFVGEAALRSALEKLSAIGAVAETEMR
jgi:hypothetical protein